MAVMALLQPHPSSWRIVDKSHYGELANLTNHGGRVKIATHQGGKWIEARDLQQAKTGKGMAVFVRRPAAENKVGGNSQQTAPASLYAPKAYENLDPTVLITMPDSGSNIDLDKDKSVIATSFKNHEFKTGDSVDSVTKALTGRANPGAIYNYNQTFNKNRPPQSGDPVRVAVGKALIVKGTVSNSGSVRLSWQSKTGSNGGQSVSVEQGGKNEIVSWQTQIDNIKPGDYTLIARAGKATHQSQVKIEGQHWLELEYVDKDGKPVKPELDYLLTFEDGTKVRGRLKQGTDYIVGIPFLPFTLDIIPGDEKQQELDQIITDLEKDLKQVVVDVQANSASLKKEWEQHPWFLKKIIADFYTAKGGALWIWDTAKGIWDLVSGVVTGAVKTAAWVGEFQRHKDKMFLHFIAGNSDGVKTESKHLNKMLSDVGEDISDSTEKGKTLYFLAHHERIGDVLGTFVKDYFAALSPQERFEFTSRYGIDIILCFIGGAGGVLLGVKNAAKISAYLNKAAEIIKILRFKKTVQKPDVNTHHKITANKKLDNRYELEKASPELVERRSKHAEFEKTGKLRDDARSVGVSEKRLQWMKNKEAPLAFKSPEQFKQFQTELSEVLNGAGLKNAPATMKGTSTTFYSENPKKPIDHHFDKNPAEPADVDIGIGGKELNARMAEMGFESHPKIKSIYKTRDTYETFPELKDFALKWEKELGREVNFVGLTETNKIGISSSEYILN